VFCLIAVASALFDIHRNGKDAAREWVGVLKENVVSIGCLALFIAVYTVIFLREWVLDTTNVGGLIITMIGLTIFSRGLAMGLMPLAENVGRELPNRIPLVAVLVVIFCLGLLCTIAEPSIQALQTAGDTVDREMAPSVKMLLVEWAFPLQIGVGVGVGIAAVIGTLRLVAGHGVKRYAGTTFLPPILLTVVACVFFSAAPDHLDRSTGLAWDCGAVTTGPVTVPIVLAIGIGMAAASRAKRTAAAGAAAPEISPSVYSSVAGNSLVVDQNLERRSKSIIGGSLLSGSVAISRKEEPVDAKADEGPNLDGFGIVTFASLLPAFTVWVLTFVTMAKGYAEPEEPVLALSATDSFWNTFVAAGVSSCKAVGPLVGFLFLCQFAFVRKIPEGLFGLTHGCFVTLIGMVCFNIGLVQSLQPIGEKVGGLMPSATDYYGSVAGDIVMLVFGFLAGMGATFSEPALSALGDTVHALTKGEFKKNSLITAVALGVGTGIMIGLAKIRYQLPLSLILIVAYIIAFGLTAVSEEAITCVAWDSAGVTTGPVTVPIVLALGGSIAQTNHVAEGFGILSCASFGPIIAVLLAGKLQERNKKAKSNELSPAMLA